MAIEGIHCCLYSIAHERQCGVCGSIQDLEDIRQLGASKILQDVVCRIHAAGRSANAYPQPSEA
jgi:hypothetical protein